MNPICCARAFKTAWFARAARKANIRDAILLKAAREVMRGQADDLGGGVYKKRLNDNQHRSIVLAKGRGVWVFAFLYAKKDRANIDPDELAEFRRIAKEYARMGAFGLNRLIEAGDLLEVRDDH